MASRYLGVSTLSALGVLLMAGCGSALGRHMGLAGFESALVAGFAVGIVLVSQIPTAILRKRVEELEKQLSSAAPNA